MKFISKSIAFICLAIFAISCGYVGEKPLESKVIYETSDLADCNIDTTAFSEMMDRNIEGAINCLEQNFKDFQRGVEHDGSGAIDQSIITSFINRFMPETRDSILNVLDVLFKINMLILKDRPDFISASNITNISKLLLITNQSAVRIKRVITNLDSMNKKYTLAELKQSRAEFKNSVESFSQNVTAVISSVTGENQGLNLEDLIESLAELANESDDKDNKFKIEDLNSLLALKKVLVGGDEKELTSEEVVKLLKNLPTLALVIFDTNYANEDVYQSEIGLYREFRKIIGEFQKIFDDRPSEELLFTKKGLLEVLKYAADYDDSDNLDHRKADAFVNAFFTVKDHVVSKGDEEVHVADIKRLAFYAKIALEGIATATKVDKLINDDTRSNQERRSEVEYILSDAKKEIETIFFNRNIELPDFDLKELIEDLSEDLKNIDDLDIDFNLIALGVPLKKLLVGGKRTDFNTTQLQLLISKISDLGLVIFDVLGFKEESYETNQEKYSFFIDLLNNAKNLIYKFKSEKNEIIFPLTELVLFADEATDYEYNIKNFKETIDVVITKFINGSAGKLTVQDIQTVLNYGLDLAESSYYNEFAYTLNESTLESNEKLRAKDLRSLKPADVPKVGHRPISYYHSEFSTLIQDLHFYRTEDGNHHYSHDIIRTRYGLNEAAFFRFATRKLLAGYCPGNNPNPEKCGVNAEEFNSFLWDFKPLLEEIKLWSSNIESFANNCLYLIDLFQTVSDGNMKIGLREGTEYFNLITSAVSMSDQILEGLSKRCTNQTIGTDEEREDDPTFLMDCFNQNVLDVWINEYGHGKYLTAFDKYSKRANQREINRFIIYLEKFIKDDPNTPVMNKREITLFVGAILNIESMLIRFDLNKDNILNPFEVDNAFKIYKNIIIEMGELTGGTKKYAKSAFKYMIKEMRFPGKKDVLKYHYNPFSDKDVSARRINIASILYYFATM